MSKALRILMLEDTPDDALLIKMILKRSGVGFESLVVDNREDFRRQISEYNPDIILSDHQLPQFNSSEALEICRSRFPFMPFILVTGAVSEEFAASIIKAGADDYLLKGNLTRLSLAINQAIEKQAIRMSYQKSEANLRNIFEYTDTAYLLIDRNFVVQTMNNLFREWIRHEMKVEVHEGEQVYVAFRSAYHATLRQVFEQVLTGKSLQYDQEMNPGEGRWFHFRYSPVRNQEQEVVGIAMAINNITQRKEAEKKLQMANDRLRFHIENAPLGFIEFDGALNLVSWSKQAERIFGWSEEEFRQLIQDKHGNVFPADRPLALRIREELKSGKIDSNQVVFRNVRKDGSVIWVSWYNSVLKNDAGQVVTVLSLVDDITSTRHAQLLIAESNERYELVSKATSDTIWDWNVTTDVTMWNHGMRSVFGYDVTETNDTAGWWQDKVHPDDLQTLLETFEDHFSKLAPNFTCSYRYRCADGTYRYVYDRAVILYEGGKPIRVIGAIQDIDERTRAQEEIKKLSIVASKTINGVVITNKADEIEWVNDSFTELTGFTFEEVAGKPPYEVLNGPKTDPVTQKVIGEKFSRGESFTVELVIYVKSGATKWVKLSLTPALDSQGKVERYIGLMSDITGQKEFEDRIIAIARELSDLIENANAPIYGTDMNGYVNEWNKVMAQLTGYSKNEALGKRFLEHFIRETDRPKFSFIFSNVLKDQPVSNLELPVVTREKEELIFLLNATPRKNAKDEVAGILMVGQNITELINYRNNLEAMVEKRTSELNQALQKEKDLVDMKSKFVSVASHEFRTPLSTISLAAESVRNHFHQLGADDVKRKLLKIEDQAAHMTSLLEDVLTMGKSDAGKIKVKLVSLDLHEFVTTLIDEVRSVAKVPRKMDLKFTSTLGTVSLDDKLFRNVFVNLLTNAIKFSPEDSVVFVRISDTSDGIEIQVEDQGIGIDQDELNTVFEAFHRGSNASNIQGTGLGLSITKKAVDLMRGTIRVDSVLNKGTTFTVKLPIR